jgi:hypothetical protein
MLNGAVGEEKMGIDSQPSRLRITPCDACKRKSSRVGHGCVLHERLLRNNLMSANYVIALAMRSNVEVINWIPNVLLEMECIYYDKGECQSQRKL